MDGLAPLAAPPAPEVDFILFPGEATLTPVPNARVFKLAFSDASRNVYLWAQEPDASKDAATLAAFNSAANSVMDADDDDDGDNDDASGPSPPAGGGAGITSAALAAALRAVGMPPPPPSHQGGGGGAVDASALAAALAGAAGGAAPPPRARPSPSLGAVLTPDALLPLVRQPGMLEALAPHLPPGHRSQQGLEAMVSSAQFREQLDKFSAALTSGALDLAHFGLQAAGFSVVDFLTAVQAAADKEKADKGEGGGDKPMQE